MLRLLEFRDRRVEAAFARHFSGTQLGLDFLFNGVLSAVTFLSCVKYIPGNFPFSEKARAQCTFN